MATSKNIRNRHIFARNLRILLAIEGLTAQEFAHQIGVSGSCVSHWLTARKTPRPTTLSQISKFFVVSEEVLASADLAARLDVA